MILYNDIKKRGTKMIKRVCVYIFGVLILGLGIVLNTKTNLGVAAVNSVPYALSQMTDLSLGNWTTLMYIVFMILQMIMYRHWNVKIVLQLPFSYVMGFIIDFYNNVITIVPSHFYQSLLILVIAIVFTALGAYLVVSMDLVANPVDGMVNTISDLTHRDFGQVKWIFDCFMMIVTIVVTMSLTGKMIGIGLGTIVSAICVGKVIQIYSHFFGKKLKNIVQISQCETIQLQK